MAVFTEEQLYYSYKNKNPNIKRHLVFERQFRARSYFPHPTNQFTLSCCIAMFQ